MKLSTALIPAFSLAAVVLGGPRDAAACGGCFVPPDESTQVTGHRMLLSVSQTQTTLWDQITYAGDPKSFAWVLPTKGIVDVGLSSDALFAFLGQSTRVEVYAPPLACPEPPWCWSGGNDGGTGFAASGSGGTGGGSPGGVTVIAEEVVGPYETVQLSSQDPAALKTWLLSHDYDIPADISPIIDAYVAGGFNFLALKLVPGQGLDSMRPVRVTTPGASPSLPLRMVGAGTGAITPITLWVMGEGRYETTNFPSFTIKKDQIVWDWDTSSSNYAELKQAGFDASDGFGWLIESARPTSKFELTDALMQVAQFMPELSGYGEADGTGAVEEATEDMETLFGTLNATALWVTRMHGELPRLALANDLNVGASSDQTSVDNFIQATKTKGTTPACPTYPPCDDATTSTGDGSGGAGAGLPEWLTGGTGGAGGAASGSKAGGGCAIGSSSSASAAMGGLGLALALAFARRRRDHVKRA